MTPLGFVRTLTGSMARGALLFLALAVVLSAMRVHASPEVASASLIRAAAQTIAAAPVGCAPNAAVLNTDVATACVAEHLRRTRGGLSHDCVTNYARYRYAKDECKGTGLKLQAEAVAQARFIAKHGMGITGNEHWELKSKKSIGAPTNTLLDSFIDYMSYDLTDSRSDIWLVELKVGKPGSKKADTAEKQVEDYAKNFESPGDHVVKLQTWPAGYADNFAIVEACDAAADRRQVRHYDVKNDVPGVVMVWETRRTEEDCDTPDDEPSPTPTPTATPTDVPRVPTRVNWPDVEREIRKWMEENPEDVKSIKESGLIAAAVVAPFVVAAVAATLPISAAAAAGAAAVLVAAAIASILFPPAAVASGDPHMYTLDGLAYDLQAVGEFHLLEIPSYGIDAQLRTRGVGTSVSVTDRVATEVNGYSVELRDSGPPLIDGQDFALADGEAALLGPDGVLRRQRDTYSVYWTRQDRVITLSYTRGQVALSVPDGIPTWGLVGDNDGVPGNDLRLGNGTRLPSTTPTTTLHGSYADSWRITDEESLFTYAPGESTATFTDRAYPTTLVTIGDFPAPAIEAATDRCRQAGVISGPQFNDCVYDILVTSDDSWAQVAAAVKDDLVDPHARGFVNGALSEDFTAPVAENFAAARYLVDPGTSRVAGPFFDGTPYSFYVTDVGRHDQLTMSARLVAYGPVDTDASAQQVQVTVDQWTSAPMALEGTGSATADGTSTFVRAGTTAQGKPFRIYDVQVPLQHYGDALKVKLTPVGFRGVLDTAMGVSMVTLGLQTAPSNDFAITLPTSVSAGVPGAGAGRLETAGAEDNYTFTLGAKSDLGIFRTDGDAVKVTLVGADGTRVQASESTGQFWRFNNLAAGAYVVRVRGEGSPATYVLAISTIPTDPNVAYRLGDPATTLTTVVAGQNAVVSFAATRGQRIQAEVSDSSFAFSELVWSVRRPDGSRFDVGGGRGEAFLDTFTLDQTGTWTMAFDPEATATGSVTFKAWAVPADVGATYRVGDPAATVTTTAGGQNASLTFSAIQGQRVLADVSDLALSGDSYLEWNIQRPDGTWLTSSTYSPFINGAPVEVFDIDQTGTWRVVFDPTTTGFGSLRFQAWTVPGDLAAAVTLDGPAATVTTTPGQNATLTFSATVGQRIAAETSGSTYGDRGISWNLRRPDGSWVRPTWHGAWDNEFWDAFSVDQTGIWTVVLDPSESSAGSVRFSAWTVPADVDTSYSLGDPAKTVTTTKAGQNAWVSFPASSGQRVSLETIDAAYGAGDMVWAVSRPDGTSVWPSSAPRGNAFWDVFDIDQTGTWRVLIDPQGAATGSVRLRGWSVSADVVTTVAIDDAPKTVTTTTPGQNATVSFQATAGQSLRVETSNTAFGGGTLAWHLVRPNGSEIRPESGTYLNDSVLDPIAIDRSGTWKVVYDPVGASLGSLKVGVSIKPLALGALSPGVASTINGLRGGQVGAWTIAGQAGQRIAVETTGSSFSSVSWRLVDPTGASLAQGTGNGWTDVVSLPTAGTYRFMVAPGGTASGSITAKAWIVTDTVSALTLGGAKVTASVGAAGARAVARFTGTAGQRVSIDLTGTTFSSVDWKVVAPSGATQASGSGNGFVEPITLPVGGSYDLVLDPPGRATGAIGVQAWSVPSDLAAGAITMGTAKSVSVTVPGQNGRATLAGTAGQRIALQTTASTYTAMTWSLLDPDGTSVASGSGNSFQDVLTLAKAGTYTMLVDPQKAATGSVSVTAWTVPADLNAGALTLGTAKSVAVTNVAQDAYVTLTGTANQRLALETTASTFTGVDWKLVSPSGATLATGAGNAFQDVVVLPAAGTYKIVINPRGNATGSLSVKAWTVPADVNAGTVTKGGAAVSLTMPTPGQNGYVTYVGTASQTVTFTTIAGTLTSASWRLLKPDGTTLATGTNATTGVVTLPATGTYRFVVDPTGSRTGTISVKAS